MLSYLFRLLFTDSEVGTITHGESASGHNSDTAVCSHCSKRAASIEMLNRKVAALQTIVHAQNEIIAAMTDAQATLQCRVPSDTDSAQLLPAVFDCITGVRPSSECAPSSITAGSIIQAPQAATETASHGDTVKIKEFCDRPSPTLKRVPMSIFPEDAASRIADYICGPPRINSVKAGKWAFTCNWCSKVIVCESYHGSTSDKPAMTYLHNWSHSSEIYGTLPTPPHLAGILAYTSLATPKTHLAMVLYCEDNHEVRLVMGALKRLLLSA
jgi:hypothetical protein